MSIVIDQVTDCLLKKLSKGFPKVSFCVSPRSRQKGDIFWYGPNKIIKFTIPILPPKQFSNYRVTREEPPKNIEFYIEILEDKIYFWGLSREEILLADPNAFKKVFNLVKQVILKYS